MTWHSALYIGSVTHQRLRPRRHKLRYSIYNMLFDLDELNGLAASMRLFSRNRFNLFSFYERDHGDGSDLRAYVDNLLRAAGITPDGGAVRLLCSPRVLGYAFNPLSTYFCYRRDGTLCAILYEVNNTFGQRHSYFIPVAASDAQGVIHQRCDKEFYVSPFMDMTMRYSFRVTPPAHTVALGIQAADENGTMLTAAFAGQRWELSDRALLRIFFAYPLLTLKIIGGIHWEALKLLLKGVRLRQRPALPAQPVSIVPPV
ncbi:DUF1365 domain-containing protein [Acidocella aquatica]|uniref:DUF1365 domain-containing protein n=1 Tax=Acidocella aquatica TaxID=1922313 RepID=A0ABQ6A592_9PROT|nr:DUF1365 family protein [Acidocella aquatica]GLR67016.1 DUF1365 domain-containing protein [Acidocella aquatica]